jgi:hypothetical protein
MKPGALVLIQGCPRVGQEGWNELAATNAPSEDEAIQAILGMNQKHVLPCPKFLFFQPLPYTKFLFFQPLPYTKFLVFSTSFLPPSPLLPTSLHFALTPLSKLEARATIIKAQEHLKVSSLA